MDRAAKYLKSLVGAPRFELGTSCAQGRRATRLRYAPTMTCCIESKTLLNFVAVEITLPVAA
jgi:hypothetical protein